MDTYEYNRQKRDREKASASRAQSATKGARESAGGGGFEQSPSASDNPLATGAPKRNKPTTITEAWKPGPALTAQEMGGALDTGEPPKAYGVNEPGAEESSPRSYLGHFANDEVIRRGHNVGPPGRYRKAEGQTIAPENVEPGTRRGRMRVTDPTDRGNDRMIIDPEEPAGYYDRQLWKESDFAMGHKKI